MDEINWNNVIFEHDKKELLHASELRLTDGAVLNLAAGVYFANERFFSYLIYFLTKRLFRNWISLNIHILRNTI